MKLETTKSVVTMVTGVLVITKSLKVPKSRTLPAISKERRRRDLNIVPSSQTRLERRFGGIRCA